MVTHATERAAWVVREGNWIEIGHRSLAKFIERSPGYEGQPVRLIGCNSGACSTGLAQNLANKMGVDVQAPTGLAYLRSDGAVWTDGEWQSFAPGGRQ